MRLLFGSEFLPDWNSGAEGSLLSIGEALEKRGHQVDYLWKDQVPGLIPHRRLHDLFELPRRQLQRVALVLKQAAYDVVILSQPYSYLVYERLAKLYPQTLFLNRTHGWEDRMSESWRQLGWRDPGMVHRHLADLSATYTTKACERTVRACQGVICASDLCSSFIENHYRPHRTPISVIPYGVESLLPRVERVAGARRLLFVGQYLPRKGSGVLERMLPGISNLYPEASMTFVVPGGDVSHVESTYQPMFQGRLEVLPWMPREKLAAVYARHDVLLFPSYFEGFGKVFLEAMAAGLCVVGFREGALPAVATHLRDALMCATGDQHAFRILTELAVGDAGMVRGVGMRARETAQRFSWERHAVETENFCRKLKFGELKAALAS
jgi:glycosyltransferase involved in cell wall biosynthesis